MVKDVGDVCGQGSLVRWTRALGWEGWDGGDSLQTEDSWGEDAQKGEKSEDNGKHLRRSGEFGRPGYWLLL